MSARLSEIEPVHAGDVFAIPVDSIFGS